MRQDKKIISMSKIFSQRMHTTGAYFDVDGNQITPYRLIPRFIRQIIIEAGFKACRILDPKMEGLFREEHSTAVVNSIT
jgi:hypothetical protein